VSRSVRCQRCVCRRAASLGLIVLPHSAAKAGGSRVSFRAEAAGRRRGIAIVPAGRSLYRDDCDSSPPPLRGSARNDTVRRFLASGTPLGVTRYGSTSAPARRSTAGHASTVVAAIQTPARRVTARQAHACKGEPDEGRRSRRCPVQRTLGRTVSTSGPVSRAACVTAAAHRSGVI